MKWLLAVIAIALIGAGCYGVTKFCKHDALDPEDREFVERRKKEREAAKKVDETKKAAEEAQKKADEAKAEAARLAAAGTPAIAPLASTGTGSTPGTPATSPATPATPSAGSPAAAPTTAPYLQKVTGGKFLHTQHPSSLITQDWDVQEVKELYVEYDGKAAGPLVTVTKDGKPTSYDVSEDIREQMNRAEHFKLTVQDVSIEKVFRRLPDTTVEAGKSRLGTIYFVTPDDKRHGPVRARFYLNNESK